jgi:catechol 2,3-dioxygenase-like lactoylglutathione lyase family enzyme
VLGPGPHDVIAFERNSKTSGKRAGGKILQRGEFGPGLPFVYVADPDGYEIEIWFE